MGEGASVKRRKQDNLSDQSIKKGCNETSPMLLMDCGNYANDICMNILNLP